MIFEKPSLRTRVTFDVGIQQLGGFSIYLSPAEINLGKRESMPDVARNLERMVQGIMIRTFSHEIVEHMARYASVPVINGLTDYSHPCQAMADYLTVFEVKGRLEGIKIAYIGDGNNVAHSLMFAGAHLARISGWPRLADTNPAAEAVQWTRERGAETGGTCNWTNDPVEAASDADVVYTDVWASMGEESGIRKAARYSFRIRSIRLCSATPSRMRIFMHCLPAHRGDEVTNEVIDSPIPWSFSRRRTGCMRRRRSCWS